MENKYLEFKKQLEYILTHKKNKKLLKIIVKNTNEIIKNIINNEK